MSRVPSVTVGIPAYNEERNIGHILQSILAQKELGYKLIEIIIASDGSKDNTASIVKSFHDSRIDLIDGIENKGQNYRQNQIVAKSTGDILVLFNGDIILEDDKVISQLIKQILRGRAHLTSQWPHPISPTNEFEKVLYAGFIMKYYVYMHINNGSNIYTSIGAMRALSKSFYTNIVFPKNSEGEDQFLYLTCISKGYTYRCARGVRAAFRLPNTFREYTIYARRIFQTQHMNAHILGESLTRKERNIPLNLMLQGVIHSFKKFPIHTILYIFLHISLQAWSNFQPPNRSHTFIRLASTKG